MSAEAVGDLRSGGRGLRQFIAAAETLAVLGGAGVSTGSGIPDYRDRDGNAKVKTPIQFQEFTGSSVARQRYWARSYLGWQRFSGASPNPAHRALVRLEAAGKLDRLITQNVDGLHQAAGNKRVINLHGDLSRVVCLDCGVGFPRADFQRQLQHANADWYTEVFALHPDGDADLAEANQDAFVVPGCPSCGGIVKPDVVMFGENVPKTRVHEASASVNRSDALLVVGTSLMVFSGLRFVRQAAESGKPIAIVNQGRTRGDKLASLKLDGDCAELLHYAVMR